MRLILLIYFTSLLIMGACTSRAERDKQLKTLEALQQKQIDLTLAKEGTENRLKTLQQDFVIAQDRLNRTSAFQLLRTPDEREQQLREATEVVQNVQQRMNDTQLYLNSLADSISLNQKKIRLARERLKN